MSHAKLLKQRINDAIEAGKYRAKGTPRAKDGPDKETSREAAASRDETPKRPSPAPDHGSYVNGLAARRRDAVGDGVQKALDERFKAKK